MKGVRKQDPPGSAIGPRILIVDDDPTIREILSMILDEAGYHVVCTESAEAALQVYNDDPFPLVFTDLRMPGMNGIELLQQIREQSEDTQVILMTAHASLESSLKSLRMGAYDYLIKPLSDHGIVLPLVERALERVRLIVENRYLVERLQHTNDELESTNRVLREITLKDGLTGLYNQRYLKEMIELELKRSRRHNRTFAVLFCDIDYFKQFNDSNGHVIGDRALERFSRLILNRLRMTDFASRYGGEEFVLLLPETHKQDAAILANDLRELVQSSEFEGQASQPGGKLSVSIGVSAFPEDGDSEDALLNAADKALYRAKHNGRNQVVVYDASA